MKRQRFLQTISVTAMGAAAAGAGWVSLRGNFRVRPVDSATCGESFLSFCNRARFATAQEAVTVTARRGRLFELYLEGDDPLRLPVAEPLRPAPAASPVVDSPVAVPQDNRRALEALKTAQTRNTSRSRRGHASVLSNLNDRTMTAG